MKHAVRQLLRTPAFTAVAVLMLATGIATTTTMFAIVDELMLKPARPPKDDRVHHLGAGYGYRIQIPDYEALVANRPAAVTALAAFDTEGGGLVQMPGRAERVTGWRVSGQYAAVHAVRAQLGRWINDEDNVGGEPDPTITFRGITRTRVQGSLGADVAVISDRLWREWFKSARDVAERGSITINQQPRRIVGVAPPGFETRIDLWVPFGRRRLVTRAELDRARAYSPFGMRLRKPAEQVVQPGIQAIARLAPGVSAKQAGAQMTAALATLPSSIESPSGGTHGMYANARTGDRRLLSTGYTILGFAALVFVAACANLGNMLFARAMEREGELATRLALGATQRAIFGVLFMETVLICGAASIAGTLLAIAALAAFMDAVPAFYLNSWQSVRLNLGLDWRVLGCGAGGGALAAIIVGAGSVWRSSRVSLLSRLAAAGPAVVAKTDGRTLRTMLVSVQVTAAVLLLIATGMLLENTSKQLDRRLLFDTTPLVTARLELPETYDAARGPHFYEQLLDRLRATPGVSSAAITDAIPGGEAPSPRRGPSAIVAEPPARGLSGTPRRLDGQWIHVSPGFLETIGLSLRHGRDVQARDQAFTDPVVLVTESAARDLWPAQDPIGKRLTCCGKAYLRTVVGVVSDPVGTRGTAMAMDVGSAMQTLTGDTAIGTYVLIPASQQYNREMLVVVRSERPDAIVQPLRDAVAAIGAEVAVFGAGPVHVTQFARASAERAVRTLAGGLGVIALSIAAFGVFAVVSYFVSRRSREFGLRMALGASRGQIIKLVIDHSIHMVLIGLLPGVLFASLGTRYFQVELTKLRPNGITMWVIVPLLMLAAGVIAAYLPAWRASRVDPNRSLKEL